MTRSGLQVDEYYSPGWVATALAGVLPDSLSGSVLDPAVGGGALLTAVEQRFDKRVSLLGIDVSEDAVRRVRQEHPNWVVSRADLLKGPSRSASLAWRAATSGDLAAVVMNPPFSYRGNGGEVTHYGSFRGRVAPSIRFLIEVMSSLEPRDGFYVILPDGALDAERHEPFWEELQRHHLVDRVARLGNSSFRGARVSTSVVRIRRSAGAVRGALTPLKAPKDRVILPAPSRCRCIEVVRGRVPLHALPVLAEEVGPRSPFVHTTDLRFTSAPRVAPDRLADTAPLLLVGRVGRWKGARLIEVGRVVLSDCLFGLRPRDTGRLAALIDSVSDIESDLRSRMRGTGAPYITLKDVSRVLQAHDWHVHVVRASSEVGSCCCALPTDCVTGFPQTADIATIAKPGVLTTAARSLRADG